MKLSDEFKNIFESQTHTLPTAIQKDYTFSKSLSSHEDRSVYLVLENKTQKKFVLKITSEASSDSAKREYEMLQAINYDSIPKAYDYFEENGFCYLLREYKEGTTLSDWIEDGEPLGEAEAVKLTLKICTILAYLQKQNPPIIYRDLKPQNIIMNMKNGNVSLIDFGISKVFMRDKKFDTEFIGSQEYAAPEQFGFSKIDLRSDVYSVGILMIYLFTGNPYLGSIEDERIPQRMRKIIEKCVQLSPDKRPKTIEHIMDSLDPTRRIKRWAPAAYGACFALVCLVAFVFLMKQNENDIPKQTAVPITADATESFQSLEVPVVAVLAGVDMKDTAVSADSHHWFTPRSDGKAELSVYAGLRTFSAAYKNRIRAEELAIESGQSPIRLDIAEAPNTEEFYEFTMDFGMAQKFELGVTNAESVTLGKAPSFVSVEKTSDAFSLLLSDTGQTAGFYSFILTAKNEKGTAVSVVNLFVKAETEPIEINSREALDQIRNNLGGHYILTSDIDLKSAPFEPIGTKLDTPFTGIFDGNGHSISGLVIDKSDGYGFGIFGCARNAQIMGVTIKNPHVQVRTDAMAGISALVGILDNSLVKDCSVLGGTITGNVEYDSGLGGLVGINRGYMEGCYNTAEVSTFGYIQIGTLENMVGGICGYMEGDSAVLRCTNAGKIIGAYLTGGITAANFGGVVTQCVNVGLVDGPIFFGTFGTGGIAQIVSGGQSLTYSYYLDSSANIGGNVSRSGAVIGLVNVTEQELGEQKLLTILNERSETPDAWVFPDGLKYPVPSSVSSNLN